MFEKVNPSHPDKVADRIAGAIVDLCYTKSRNRWSNESSAKLDLSTAETRQRKTEGQQTMEEYLLSQLDTPVILKDGTMMTKPDGSVMTKQEAIATNLLNQAMKGDIRACQYIQNIQMTAKIMKKK